MILQPPSTLEKSSEKSGARFWMETRIGSTRPVTQAGLGVAVGGRVGVAVGLGVKVGVTVGLVVGVAVEVAVGVTVGVGVGVAVGVTLGVEVGVEVGVGVNVAVGVGVSVGVAVGVGEGVALASRRATAGTLLRPNHRPAPTMARIKRAARPPISQRLFEGTPTWA